MKKLVLLPIAAMAATSFAAPASAQVAPSGLRAELVAGWDFVTAQDDFGGEYDNDGSLFGIGVGYDIPVGGMAIGLDAELSRSDIEDVAFYTDGDFDVQAELTTASDLYLGGRLTIPVGARTDVYLKAGYSRLETDLDIYYDDGFDVFRESFSDTENGVRVGTGLQYALASNAYLGGEYRFTSYDSDLDKHQVAATLGMRF